MFFIIVQAEKTRNSTLDTVFIDREAYEVILRIFSISFDASATSFALALTCLSFLDLGLPFMRRHVIRSR